MDTHPPIALDWRVPGNLPGGDYAVPMVLTYLSDDGWHSTTYDLPIHVSQFWERTPFQIIAEVAGIVGILAGGAVLVMYLFQFAAWLSSHIP
jgi:hypothetical protein